MEQVEHMNTVQRCLNRSSSVFLPFNVTPTAETVFLLRFLNCGWKKSHLRKNYNDNSKINENFDIVLWLENWLAHINSTPTLFFTSQNIFMPELHVIFFPSNLQSACTNWMYNIFCVSRTQYSSAMFAASQLVRTTSPLSVFIYFFETTKHIQMWYTKMRHGKCDKTHIRFEYCWHRFTGVWKTRANNEMEMERTVNWAHTHTTTWENGWALLVCGAKGKGMSDWDQGWKATEIL